MEYESPTQSDLTPAAKRIEGIRRLGRDVGVNVLANLITAAVIYLLAVLTGALRANPALVGIAMFALFGGTGTVLLGFALYAARQRPHISERISGWSAIATGLAVLLAGVTGAATGGNLFWLPVPIGIAALLFILGGHILRSTRHQKTSKR